MTDWLQVAGSLYALPATRGDEAGSYLWLEAGERTEAVVAELFLPAVRPDRLDAAMGVAIGSVQADPGPVPAQAQAGSESAAEKTTPAGTVS